MLAYENKDINSKPRHLRTFRHGITPNISGVHQVYPEMLPQYCLFTSAPPVMVGPENYPAHSFISS